MMNEILSVQEAAHALGLRPVSVYAALKAGRMRPLRWGRPILLTRAEVERYRRERRSPGRPKKFSEISAEPLDKQQNALYN